MTINALFGTESCGLNSDVVLGESNIVLNTLVLLL